ncbi:hypothetical protein AUR64_04015 [Haloprofundus marisrubri]|uniref:Uncharacterized protein n=1 Tax=Haloprofundus marisrubri TaxID=1514971 RepID=A0A0W1RFJ8_9EURY|nr:hypothetical protein [Haloprofundus marisrubri]KTG11428.1 hypothetical protein AUR64_04015 [Haloprofundus marisrubri]
MATEKPDKTGQIECLLCNRYYWYINTVHLRTAHNMEFDDYAKQIAEKHGYDGNEAPFDDDTLHSADNWKAYSGDVELDIGIETS